MSFLKPSSSAFAHTHQETHFDHPLYPVTAPQEEKKLKVSEKHTIFYATYGNPNGIPIVVLHGGPGAGCDDTLSRFFDLSKWYVVMFDQRGAMRSEPFACMDENTPQHSVEDIESLRKLLKIEQWMVFGGSWGTTLALLYGQAHPARCLGFILRGIFLGRKQDYMHVLYGMGKVFPEAYEPFVEYIPENERSDLFSAYYLRIMDPNPDVHLPAARAFIRFDMICATHLPNQGALEKILKNEKLILSMTRAFFHYCINDFFLTPNQILSHMDTIAHIPSIIVHGRWDAIDLPEMAYLLYKSWDASTLWILTQGGHSANDPAIASALATATDTFADSTSRIGCN